MATHNLADLPDAERQAIEDDKRRWLQAHRMLQRQTRSQITNHLAGMPEDEREDRRRRLNTIKGNRKKGRAGQ